MFPFSHWLILAQWSTYTHRFTFAFIYQALVYCNVFVFLNYGPLTVGCKISDYLDHVLFFSHNRRKTNKSTVRTHVVLT